MLNQNPSKLLPIHIYFEYTNELGGSNHWGPNYYDAAIHKGHMDWDNSEWVNEIDSTTGKLAHQKIAKRGPKNGGGDLKCSAS